MVGITIHTMEYPNIPSYGALAQQEVIRISQTDRTCDHHENRGSKGVSWMDTLRMVRSQDPRIRGDEVIEDLDMTCQIDGFKDLTMSDRG